MYFQIADKIFALVSAAAAAECCFCWRYLNTHQAQFHFVNRNPLFFSLFWSLCLSLCFVKTTLSSISCVQCALCKCIGKNYLINEWGWGLSGFCVSLVTCNTHSRWTTFFHSFILSFTPFHLCAQCTQFDLNVVVGLCSLPSGLVIPIDSKWKSKTKSRQKLALVNGSNNEIHSHTLIQHTKMLHQLAWEKMWCSNPIKSRNSTCLSQN